MKKVDFLIIGQGLAGSFLSFELIQRGHSVLVIDNGYASSSSIIAPGTFNPVNFKKIVKNWKVDTLIPALESSMDRIEKRLGSQFLFLNSLVRPFQGAGDFNNWTEKSVSDELRAYLTHATPEPETLEGIDFPKGYGITPLSGFLDLERLLPVWREDLIENDRFLEDQIDTKDLEFKNEGVRWGKVIASKVILCTGYVAMNDAWFGTLPFSPTKGENLTVRIPGLRFGKLMKGKFFFLPLGGELYKIGSNYNRQDIDQQPTEEGRLRLLEGLKELIGDREVEVIAHKAGVRPTVKDRRPFIGLHPENPRLGIFNGLGSKGVLLAPYYASRFAAHLLEGESLDPEVDVRRFFTAE